MLRTFYLKVAKRFAHKANKLTIDVCLTATAGYYALKKYLGFSLTAWLSDYFTPAGVPWVAYPLCGLLVYSVLGKVFLLISEAFPATRVKVTEAGGLNHCCLRINDEISRHIQTIANEPASATGSFTSQHSFDINVGLVVLALAEQLRNTLDGAARNRDIFISVYSVPTMHDLAAPREQLDYLTHFPPDRDLVRSRTLLLSPDGPFRTYECVKCINAQEDTRLDWDCADYEKTPAKRHKTVSHYIGMKIKCNIPSWGF
ncbi:MAG: hypothetical protein JWQ44_1015 [Chthoniobacter sp.]|nr:hypothetical protein [Chthoniobacter sp.]